MKSSKSPSKSNSVWSARAGETAAPLREGTVLVTGWTLGRLEAGRARFADVWAHYPGVKDLLRQTRALGK